MIIEEAFKLFHANVMNDPDINKQGKELAMEVHKNTELIDISAIFDNEEDFTFTFDFKESITLPFENNFIKMSNTLGGLFLYIREFQPFVYTGAVLLPIGNNECYNAYKVVFTMTVEENGNTVWI